MPTLHPYVYFDGNCREAFAHYRTVFGGEYMGGIATYADAPPMPGAPELTAEQSQRVMHMALPIGPHTYLNGSDTHPHMGSPAKGDRTAILIAVGSREEATQIANGLGEGGHFSMPMEDTFWGSYFGMLTDRWGIDWMISYSPEMPS